MFTDPQNVTLATQSTDLPRIKNGDLNATYRTADGNLQMRISHQATKSRTRRMVRLDQTVVAEDPLTATNVSQSLGIYFVIDEPVFGFSDIQIDDLADALIAWLTTANIAKVLGSES
jgi:hypothetical protein